MVDLKISGSFSLFHPFAEFSDAQELTYILLHNLFCVTSEYYSDCPDEIELCWKLLVSVPSNSPIPVFQHKKFAEQKISTVIDFLVFIIVRIKTTTALATSKNIVMYLSRTEYKGRLFDQIVSRLNTESLTPLPLSVIESLANYNRALKSSLFIAKIEPNNNHPLDLKDYPITYLFLSFLVDVSFELESYSLAIHTPTLLTLIFVLIDGHGSRKEEMRIMLVNLIQSCFNKEKGELKKIEPILSALNSKVCFILMELGRTSSMEMGRSFFR